MIRNPKGHHESIKDKKPKGRPVGSKNKLPVMVKEMVEQALAQAGGAQYLYQQSQENPAAFLSLVRQLLPKDANVNVSGSLGLNINWPLNRGPLDE